MIRFGSRLDVWLPAAASVLVAEGQTAIAGETVLARFGGERRDPARAGRLTERSMSIFQPFDPDDEPRRRRLRQLRPIPVRAVLPNLVTLLALCAGLTSIRMSIEMRYEWAIAAVAIAAALDGIDGQVARFLKSTSRFGAELELARRLRQFRRRAGDPALCLGARRDRARSAGSRR